MLNNSMRIAGLASGIDTESIINDLMKAERMPLDKLFQQKQWLEWQRDAYRDINKLLQDLDTLIFDGIDRQKTFLQKTVTSSNESAVMAKAVSVSNNVSNRIEVSQLAESATWKTSVDHSYSGGASYTAKFQVTDPGASTAREVEISISSTDTVDDVIQKINRSNLGVTAIKEQMFNDATGVYEERIGFSYSQTGSGAEIKLANADAAALFESLGFRKADGSTYASGEAIEPVNAGQNAVVTLNGFQIEKTSNVFTVNGIEYTLKTTTIGPVTISTSTDTEAILDTVVKFVDEYNKMIDTINEKLIEDRYRDYKPLTDAQREEMTEKQIELWEEKAKSGLLRNDSILSSGLNQLRIDLYTPVELADGTKLQLADFGITTSSNYRDRGKLIIDEAKLREAINEDPNKVYELFNGQSGSVNRYETEGIAGRLRNSLEEIMNQIEAKAGNTMRTNQQFTIGRSLIDVDEQIERMQERLIQIENRYWRQFTAMEQAVQRANQQSMYLMQQFGGMGY